MIAIAPPKTLLPEGRYLTDGMRLFRVLQHLDHSILLEDCYTESTMIVAHRQFAAMGLRQVNGADGDR